jgi:lipid II:glycine glycyltransferase (peptidoglycan interpeptide bridge formation enzyme)
MVTIERKIFLWKVKEIWFSEVFFLSTSSDILLFRQCQENRKVEDNNIRKKEFTTTLINLNKNEDEIWNNFAYKSCKYEINRGNKLNLKLYMNTNYDEFYKLLNTFIEIKGYTHSINRKRFSEITEHGDLFTVEFNGEIICGHFCLVDGNNRARYLWGASKRLLKEYGCIVGAANRWLHWQAIKYYKRKGVGHYDFGGINLNPDSLAYGITKFKLSFGGEIEKEYHYVVVNNSYLKLAKTFIFKGL